jgi:hypothetical protein
VFDYASGLYMNGNGTRDRLPGASGFIEADPQGHSNNDDAMSLHKYLYAGADPTMGVDPSGHDLIGTLGAAGIANTLSSLEFTGFSAVYDVAKGVAEGQTANQILTTFLIQQAFQAGAFVGLAAAGSLIGALRDGSLFAPLLEEGGEAAQDAALASSELTNSFSNLGEGFSQDNAAALQEFGPGSAFSGIYSPETGRFLAYPSEGTLLADGTVPENLVPRRGGHMLVNAAFSDLVGMDPTSNVGFTLFREQDGTISIEWLSRSVNGRNPSFDGVVVPESLRPQIIEAIKTATGLNVVSAG